MLQPVALRVSRIDSLIEKFNVTACAVQRIVCRSGSDVFAPDTACVAVKAVCLLDVCILRVSQFWQCVCYVFMY